MRSGDAPLSRKGKPYMASGVVMILLATTDAESRVTHLRPAYVCNGITSKA